VKFARDARRALSAGHLGELLYWEPQSGRTVFGLRGHDAAVSSVAFTPDGRHALTGSMDTTVRL
jgi:WD40 repeat protein